MQKKAKTPGLLSLWEVWLVLSTCVVMAAAAFVVGNVADSRSQARTREAEAKAEEEERLRKERETAKAEEDMRREQERAEAEAARIAAGPIVPGMNEDGKECYQVDYILGTQELSVGENGCSYGEILDLKQYNAYNARWMSFCYPPALYTQVEETDQSGVMDDWFLTTFTAGDGSILLSEYRTSSQPWDPDDLCQKVWDAYGLTGEIVEREELEDEDGRSCVRIIWKGEKSDGMAEGVLYVTLKGMARILTVICPSGQSEEDRLHKEFYMDSVIGTCSLSGKGQTALTWDAWRDGR